jgi:hypothetical protein
MIPRAASAFYRRTNVARKCTSYSGDPTLSIFRKFPLPLLALFAATTAFTPALRAQQDTTLNAKPVDTMTCTGGSAVLVLPVYAITADLTTSLATSFFTIYTDTGHTNLLASAFFFNNSYDGCSFSPGLGTSFGSVKLQSVSLAAAGPGVQTPAARAYASATFSYSLISIGPVSMTATASNATPAEKAKALADHISRGLALPSTK